MLRTLADMRPWHKLLAAVLVAVVLAQAAAFTVVAQSQVQQARLRADLERAGRSAPAPDPALARIGGPTMKADSKSRGAHPASNPSEAGVMQVGYATTSR